MHKIFDENRREDIIRGNFKEVMKRMYIPTILSSMVSILYTLADTYWLGGLGYAALSAPVMSWIVQSTLFSIVVMCPLAVYSIIPQLIGKNRVSSARSFAGTTLSFTALLVFTTVLIYNYLIVPNVHYLFGSSPEVLEAFKTYTFITAFSTAIVYLGSTLSSIISAWGYPDVRAYVSLPFTVLNIILDPLLLYGVGPIPALGIRGVAYATLISEVLEVVTYAVLISSKTPVHISLNDLVPKKEEIKEILRVGLPHSVNFVLTYLALFVVLTIGTRISDFVVAAFGLVYYVTNIFSTPILAFITIGTVVGGEYIGVGEYDYAKKVFQYTLKVVLLASLIVFTIITFASPYIGAFFVRGGENVDATINEFVVGMTTFGLTNVPYLIATVYLAPFRASGKTYYETLFSIIRFWILRVPCVTFLVFLLGLGNIGFWLGLLISNVGSLPFAYYLYSRESWKL